MSVTRVCEHSMQAAIVNPILLTISNSASALPPVGSAVRTSSPLAGGFAAALAAAQDAPAATPSRAGAQPVSSGLATGTTEAASSSSVAVPPATGQPPKKQSSGGMVGSAAGAGLGLGVNLSVPIPLLEPAGNLIPKEVSGLANGQVLAPVEGGTRTVQSKNAAANVLASSMISPSSASESSVSPNSVFPNNTSPNNLSFNNLSLSNLSPEDFSASMGLVSQSQSGGENALSMSSTASATPAEVSSGSAPILIANASVDSGSITGSLLASAMNPQSVPANTEAGIAQTGVAENGIAGNGSAAEVNLSAGAASGNAPQILNAQNLDAQNSLPVAPPPLPFVPGGVPLPAVPPKVIAATTTPAVHGAIQSTVPGTGSSSPTAVGADTSGGSSASSPTPFSVFFSDSGPGAQSAASTLPKMILPAAGPALRDSHTGVGGVTGASPQSNGAQGSSPQNSSPQNGNGNNSTSTPAGASASLAAAQTAHHTADPAAPNAQLGSAQAAGPALPAPAATPTGTTVAIAGQVTGAPDSLPKANAVPMGAQDVPSRAVPVPAEQTAVVPSPVQMAQMVTRSGESEMRIGMNTSAFGSVEVRTTVHANDVSLAIGSEKGDLRTLLANDIPIITSSLQQQNLRLNSVNFMQGFAFSNNSSGGGNSQPQSFVPARVSANRSLPDSAADNSRESLPGAGLESGSGSLSILA
jgi:Flagellar hook-length control protein FliK